MTPQTPIERMQFVKVTITDGRARAAGYLTDASISMLLVELDRGGFEIVNKRRTDGVSEDGK